MVEEIPKGGIRVLNVVVDKKLSLKNKKSPAPQLRETGLDIVIPGIWCPSNMAITP
jgi:hypothetical protein